MFPLNEGRPRHPSHRSGSYGSTNRSFHADGTWKHFRVPTVLTAVLAMIACMTLGLLNASPASAAPSGTVTAVQQADQTVIVTYTETGAGPGGMQLRLTDLPRVYGSGYTGCPTDQDGNVNCSVHTAAAYTDSTIRYEFDDLSGNLSWGPYTIDVTPYDSTPAEPTIDHGAYCVYSSTTGEWGTVNGAVTIPDIAGVQYQAEFGSYIDVQSGNITQPPGDRNYRALDGDGNVIGGPWTITMTYSGDASECGVGTTNQNPVAADDSVSTDENTAATVDVLANDSDPDGDSLTVTDASGASHGTTSVVSNQVVYTPATDYYGSDSFTYTISDGNGGTASATVSVTVNQVVAPPTSVTPQAPTATTPSCTNTAETVTPPTQDGVVWSPSGPTTLQPGDPTVTYTDTPASGYVFPDGTQTSWPFSNDFDTSTCGTGGSTPPPPPVDDGPHAGFRALPIPALGLVVNFDGSASTGTAPLTYLWDFGDGTTDNNNVADPGNHTYAQPGMYHVTLTVTDGLGRHVTAFADITVASQAKLVLSPSRGVRAGGIERVGIAATSSDGSAAANTTVAVKVTGADKASGTVVTNANGRAVFHYRTHHVGRDHIVVTSSDASARATVTIFHPLEKPTLTVATRHGQLYGYVRTHPAVSRHWVTVYYLRKQNGKTTLRVAGHGLTNSNGRVRVTLSLPAGHKFTLKARMSSHAYAEKFSAPVVVMQ